MAFLTMLLCSTSAFATEIVDATASSKSVEFLCGQTDSVRLILDNSWVSLSHVRVEIIGTNLTVSGKYYMLSDLVIPTNSNVRISILKLNLIKCYGFVIGILSVITIVLVVIKAKEVYRKISMIETFPELIAIFTVFFILNFVFLLSDSIGVVHTQHGMVLFLTACTTAIMVFAEIIVFKLTCRLVYFIRERLSKYRDKKRMLMS